MKNILKKALDELNKEEPRIDYVRGILEVLIEEEPVIPEPKPVFIPAKEITRTETPDIVPMSNPIGTGNLKFKN